ncbi:MAG: aldehyde dehydrogenase family protein, partial [Candidatus Dormibacteraeota bacterium]|nr:aldehyde dehydrogenase family protein [Candidatus Dormibacteraeota bacterium]
FQFFAGEALRLQGERVPSVRPGVDIEVTREPVGVVGVITPWNFPIAIPSWKIAPALCYGNCVVFKPADLVPGSAHALAEIIVRAGVPKGVFNLVMGRGSVVGETLLNHKDVTAVTFTGSVATGRKVAGAITARMGKFQLEMGGKNPLVVLDDADLKIAVECATNGAFFSTGQRCTASSRLIVEQPVLHDFTERLLERTAALRLGDGLDAGVDVGPVINETQLRRIDSYTDVGRGEGATLALGGAVARDGALAEGWFYTPTVFTDVTPAMRIAQEEIFGPTTVVMPVRSLDDALAAANSTQYGLSLSVYTNDLRTAFRAINELHSGIVYVNAPTIGAEIQLPFGGTRNTGNGHREAGGHALDEFSEWKSIYVDYSGRLQRAQIDTE